VRIDRNTVIGGRPAKQVRNLLRKMENRYWGSSAIAEYFCISTTGANVLIDRLVELELLNREENQSNGKLCYVWGENAGRLANAKLLKPIDRKKADELVAGLLQRIKKVNVNDYYLYVVDEVRLFGSYIDASRHDFGDVDAGVKLARRSAHRRLVDQLEEREQQGGPERFGSYVDWLRYPELEVMRFLRNRSRYLSLRNMHQLEELGATATLVLYGRSAGDA
jgi:hypothetical protein